MTALGLFLAMIAALAPAFAQQAEESYRANGQHPSLLLNARRLRLLKRERERRSLRWEQFDALMSGRARMPEPGFAEALYFQVTGDMGAGRRAVEWALGEGKDLRQLALVLDWCQPVLSDAQMAQLDAKIRRALDRSPAGSSPEEADARVLAAIALADRAPDLSERELRKAVTGWWRGTIVTGLDRGQDVLPRASLYAVAEILHAVRDNLNIDLRESASKYFSQLPLLDLLSYYPAPLLAPENEYRIPAAKGGEPEVRRAEMARAADLAMAAYDGNSTGGQYLQGWVMHDAFMMKSAFGTPYEFLWANPYQPGLSYYSAPLLVHDETVGQLFARSSWDDDAQWIGCFDGQIQTFAHGAPQVLAPGTEHLFYFGQVAVAVLGSSASVTLDRPLDTVFFIGLKSGTDYEFEFGRHHKSANVAGRGGIAGLQVPADFRGEVRIHEVSHHR
jgi:hypothetical protein